MKLFQRNESTLDRALRVIVGVALLWLASIDPEMSWGYIGIVPLLTGILGSCPAYSLFGFSTCKLPATEK